jgi:hypothetical protein
MPEPTDTGSPIVRQPLLTGNQALRERLHQPAQVIDESAPEAELPPYLESFLAHLRLLVGVSFEYLIPDERLLPDESIRFFYVDRSWTDRLVDGVFAVGKIGSREQAHHQAAHPAIRQTLDMTERLVRSMQRGQVSDFTEAKDSQHQQPAEVITGFLLRSALVAGWPHMDVRAFSRVVSPDELRAHPELLTSSDLPSLPLLRLERLAPAVLLALFAGVPQLVWLEEPHHGVQFGVYTSTGGSLAIYQRTSSGAAEDTPSAPPIRVPVRRAHRRVVAIDELRRRIHAARQRQPATAPQTGSAAFATELLRPPWRQRFEHPGAASDSSSQSGFVPAMTIADRVRTLSADDISNILGERR